MSSPEFLYQIEYGDPISSNKDSILYERRLIQKNPDGSITEMTWQEEVPKQTKLNIPSKKSQ
ncbi:MAG: hypothetical protein PHN66_00130 [Candidatus Shapirobacteria bacterium]|nr:hypothetical protein [Candidatus Shapirobacteria bacterium]